MSVAPARAAPAVGAGLRAALAGSVVLAAVSLLAPSVPTTDPWGWIVWGRELVGLHLNTVAGPPSWKPLPVLFTAPLSLLGGAAPAAWLLVARTGGVLALYFAYRLAGGRVGGVVAAVALAVSAGWLRGWAHGYSEGLAVALLLAGVECHRRDRRLPALALFVLVSLSRPEAWPFAALYAAVFVRRPAALALLALTPLLWLVPDWWGSGDPFHAGVVARVNLSRAGAHPGLELLRSGAGLLPAPVWLAAVVGLYLAVRRRELLLAALGAVAIAWIGGEAAATELGYPGSERFLVLPAALVCVLAGVGVAWSLPRAPRIAFVALLAALALPSVAATVTESLARARFQLDLRRAVAQAGGPRLLRGGAYPVLPSRLWWNAGAVAWDLHVPLEQVHKLPEAGLATLRGLRAPAVLLAPLGGPPVDDPDWVPTRSVARCDLTTRVVGRAGVWRVLVVSRRTPSPRCADRARPQPPRTPTRRSVGP